MGEIIYNGRSSKEIGLEVETFPQYQTPKRSYTKVHIPGRNGDLIIDNECWENVVRSYSVSIGSHYRQYFEMVNKVSDWLHSTYTYARLEDSYEPDYYRLGVYLDELTMSNLFNQGGKATIEFDCKPQRFLKLGDEPIVISKSPNVVQNPTNYTSLPIVHIYGSGQGNVQIGDYQISISEIGTHLVVDSDIQDAYANNENRNSRITIPNGFPKLKPGTTTIGYSGGVTRLEVIPKWFTL